jgi:hypothetical protein
MPISHTLFCFGARGSGKQTLVRTFAAQTGITLIEAYAPGFDPQTEMDGMFTTAMASFPSIILFNECEGFFSRGSPHCGVLWGWLEKIRESRVPVWVVFCSQVKPEILDLSILRLIKTIVWAGVLNKADLERVWVKSIELYLPQSHPNIPLQVSELALLVRASENCIARNIIDFVVDVFQAKIAALGAAVELEETGSEAFVPTAVDFQRALIVNTVSGDQRITRGIPMEENVQCYTNIQQTEQVVEDPYGSFQK